MVDTLGARAAHDSHPADPIAAMVNADGLLTAEAERAANISDDVLRDLYRRMAICRRLDQEGLNLQRQGELGLWGPIAGHEAAQVGAAMAMAETDWIFPYYRDFAMTICRGVDPGIAMTWFRGLTHGAWNPYEHRLGPLIISVGTQVPHAVGFAIGCKLDHEPTAVLVGFGEGSTSTGDWHEAMNFAGVFKAPVVFLCENNQWAISVPMREQVAGRVADRAAGYGFPGLRIDGSDVLTVYTVVRAAADRARHGEGPYLVEALTYRFQAHTTSDDPTRYRTDADVEPWRAKDSIARATARLRDRGAFSDDFERAVAAEAEETALAMRATLLSAATPHPGQAFDLVFANPPASLLREQAEFVAELEPGSAE
ncbi:MAG: Branched-chain alpha-keto acid dehydrogenase, E1 component, alpha subunit [Ktedonobacterales bacterium]|nr:MAG: Branched-chain alpha-keto acid dehydrogenase, E1 component, alpha subunit [Ktedonobacterales bacterium]